MDYYALNVEDLFKLVGYSFTMVDLTAWKLAQARQGREEIPPSELMEERKPRIRITCNHELQEQEEIQSQ